MTLEDRLTKLEGIVEATLKLLPDRVSALDRVGVLAGFAGAFLLLVGLWRFRWT